MHLISFVSKCSCSVWRELLCLNRVPINILKKSAVICWGNKKSRQTGNFDWNSNILFSFVFWKIGCLFFKDTYLPYSIMSNFAWDIYLSKNRTSFIVMNSSRFGYYTYSLCNDHFCSRKMSIVIGQDLVKMYDCELALGRCSRNCLQQRCNYLLLILLKVKSLFFIHSSDFLESKPHF